MMKFDKELYDQIDAYLQGTMSDEEKLFFESKMESNTLLKEEVILNQKIKKEIQDKDWSLTKDINEFKKEDVSEIRSYLRSSEFIDNQDVIKKSGEEYFNKIDQTTKKKKWIYYGSAVVAIILVLIVFRFTNNRNGQKLYESYSNWGELPSLIVQGGSDKLLSEGEILFENQKYNEAISIFTQFLQNQETLDSITVNPYVFSYLGASYLELNNHEMAMKYFQKIQDINTIDYSRAYWYKALLYIKKSEMQKAKKELLLILEDENNYNFQKAKDVLKEIE